MIKRTVLLLLPLFITVFSCWNKQEHDIERPNVPQYVFSGSVSDWYSGNTLSDIKIVVEAKDQLYDITFETREVNTDKNGLFTVDPIYPGRYFVTLYRYDHAIQRYNFQLEHGDEVRNYVLPSRYDALQFKADDSVIFDKPMTINNTHAIVWDQRVQYLKNNNTSWNSDQSVNNPLKNIYISTITGNDSLLYACQSPDTVYVLNAINASVVEDFRIDNVNLLGLTLDDQSNTLWGCSLTMIFKFSQSPLEIVNTYTVNAAGMQAMAFYHQLYVFDNSKNVCFRFDNDMNNTGVFCLIDPNDNTLIRSVSDLAFDKSGKLWVIQAE